MASLVVIDGPAEGVHCRLVGPITSVGRDTDCTLQVLDAMVSRKHLQVRVDPATGGHLAADYRSANGVSVNDTLILHPTPLRDGDRIRIGQTTLMYLGADLPDAPTAVAAAMKKKTEWNRSTLMGGG